MVRFDRGGVVNTNLLAARNANPWHCCNLVMFCCCLILVFRSMVVSARWCSSTFRSHGRNDYHCDSGNCSNTAHCDESSCRDHRRWFATSIPCTFDGDCELANRRRCSLDKKRNFVRCSELGSSRCIVILDCSCCDLPQLKPFSRTHKMNKGGQHGTAAGRSHLRCRAKRP